MILIRIIKGKDLGREFEFSKPRITCGRSGECDITVDDRFASSIHGVISQLGERTSYKDLRSTNGSRVKHANNIINLGVFTSECEIQTGDEILLGKTAMKMVRIQPETTRLHSDMDELLRRTMPREPAVQVIASPEQIIQKAVSAESERIFALRLIAKSSVEELLISAVEGILTVFPKATHAVIGFAASAEESQSCDIIFGMRRDDNGLTPARVRFSHILVQEAIRREAGILLPAPEYRRRGTSSESIKEIGIYTCLCVPLIYGEKPVGFVQVYNDFSSPLPFDRGDLELLVALSLILLLEYLNIQNREALRQAELRSAVLQILSAVSHDSQSTIGGLERFMGSVDHLLEPLGVTKEGISREEAELLRWNWNVIRDGIDFVGNLSKWMLSLALGSAQEEVKKEPIEIGDVAKRAWKLCKMCFDDREADKFQLEMGLKEKEVLADEMLLRCILFNCFKNSCEAMIGSVKRYEPVTVGAFRDSLFDTPVKVVASRDRGPGIREDILRRIFREFYTTKGNRGSGIGTTVMHELTVRQGGFLQIASKVGEGTLVVFNFPEEKGVRLSKSGNKTYEIVDDFGKFWERVVKKLQ